MRATAGTTAHARDPGRDRAGTPARSGRPRRAGALGIAGLLLVGVLGGALAGCDRKVEPFVPGERPSEPDLRRIFPPGAEQAAQQGPPGAPPSGMPAAPPEPAPGAVTPAAGSGEPVQGVVEVAPELAGQAPEGGVLFIMARRGAGGPPLAVKRVASPRFPVSFELGPDDRMIQAMPFAGPFTVSARLDADGNATTRSPGDLQGAAPAPVDPGAEGVLVRLDEVL